VRAAIVERPIDGGGLLSEASRTTSGAAILFIGTVRDLNDGRRVSGIDYSAYEPMADLELKAIAGEASRRFETDSIVVEHRIGHLEIGETSVGIAVAHPHREAAYEASRFIIEQIKLRVPIWKREEYADGSREWVDPMAIRQGVER